MGVYCLWEDSPPIRPYLLPPPSSPPPVLALQALEDEKKSIDAKLAASAGAQGDLRAAVMVKDKVLEDREKVGERIVVW